MVNKLRTAALRGLLLLLLVTAGASAASARNFDLDQAQSVDLSGVREILFDLRGISCALCVRTADVHSTVSGGGTGSAMNLALSGRISSNRDRAVPSIIVEESGRRVVVRLYPENRSFFGLSQSGSAEFTAQLPSVFSGRVEVRVSSDDAAVRDLDVEALLVRSASGDLEAESLRAGSIDLSVASGDLRTGDLESSSTLNIDSASGDVTAGNLIGDDIHVSAASGRIRVGSAAGREVALETASGDIDAGTLDADRGSVRASSGDVDTDILRGGDWEFRLASGDLGIAAAENTGRLTVKNTSGDATVGITELNGGITMDMASGDVELTLPGESAFDVRLKTASGRIRTEFPVTGEITGDRDDITGTVNGGGAPVNISTASGNITLTSGR